MRFRILIVAMFAAILAMAGCKGKPSLSLADAHYVRTTIALIRVKSSLMPNADTNDTKRRLDSIYHAHSTSQNAYLAETKAIGSEAERAGVVYAAIKDSLGVK